MIRNNTPNIIKDQLRRYQIFETLVDEKGNRIVELEDCCFVHALKVSHLFPENVLNQIRLRIQNRYLPFKSIDEICEEFKICLLLHYIDQNINRQVSPQNKRYFGVKLDEASYCVEMNLFQKHYFLEEPTPISCYYLKHIDSENE